MAAEPVRLPAVAEPNRRRRQAALWFAAALALVGSHAARAQARGFTLAVEVPHAAFHVRGVPSAIVHAPPWFDAKRPLRLVVFLHGYSCCAPVLMASGEASCRPGDKLQTGWDLGAYHDAAHTNTLLVVPQLAFMKRDGSPGGFGEPGGFRRFLEELLSSAPLARALGRPHTLNEVAAIDLLAHSGGYHTALAILERGELGDRIKSVVLFDALYGETPSFAEYIEQHAVTGLRFVSIALAHGLPSRENQALLARLRRTLGAEQVTEADAAGLARAIAAHPIVIAEGTPPHRLVPAHHMAEVLRALETSAAH